MIKRKLGNLEQKLKDKNKHNVCRALPTHYLIHSDNSIIISSEALRLLGVNPDEYKDLPKEYIIEAFKDKIVGDKLAYITDELLFTPEGRYKAYPEIDIKLINF